MNGSAEENIFSSGTSSVTWGNIEQAMIRPRTKPLPLNRSRASAYAATMPKTRVRSVLLPEMITELIRDRPKLLFPENTPT